MDDRLTQLLELRCDLAEMLARVDALIAAHRVRDAQGGSETLALAP